MFFDGTKQIKFIKEFSSTVYGNVWYGRIATVKSKQADHLIQSGLAEEVTKAKTVEAEKAVEVQEDDKRDNTKRGKKSSKGDE